jgi:hypothetical protein
MRPADLPYPPDRSTQSVALSGVDADDDVRGEADRVALAGESERASRHALACPARSMMRLTVMGCLPIPGRDELEPALKRGEAVALSLLANLKVQLFIACRQAGVSRADLVRALGWHREQVDRLFRFDHSTRPDQFDAAFAAIGKAVSIEVEDIGRAAA